MPRVNNLDTLSKILAQAENAGTEAEADAFMQRALQMSQSLGVGLDIARAHAAKAERTEPEKRRYEVGSWNSRYNKHMVELFCAVAEPFDMKVTIGGRDISVHAWGMPHDHELVNAIWQVAAVRMVSDANAALKRGDHKVTHTMANGEKVTYSRIDGRVWRAHFYQGYIATLRARMYEDRRQARREADLASREGTSPYMNESDQNPSLAMVLSDKRKSVDDQYKKDNPHWYHPDGTMKGNVPSWKGVERDDYDWRANEAGSTSARNTDLRDARTKKVGTNARGVIEG